MSSDEDAPSRERDDEGRYLADVTPDDVLGVFDSVEGPTITTSDIVNVLDCSREVARNRLNELVERGLVARRKSGRVVLWWRVESDEETENPYLRGFGALADTDLPEEMKQEREQAREAWAQHGDGLSG
jgi:predicted transcriptional regulator